MKAKNKAHAAALRDVDRARIRLSIARLHLEQAEQKHLNAQAYYNERVMAVERLEEAARKLGEGDHDE